MTCNWDQQAIPHLRTKFPSRTKQFFITNTGSEKKLKWSILKFYYQLPWERSRSSFEHTLIHFTQRWFISFVEIGKMIEDLSMYFHFYNKCIISPLPFHLNLQLWWAKHKRSDELAKKFSDNDKQVQAKLLREKGPFPIAKYLFPVGNVLM